MKRVPCWSLLFALLAACGDTLPRTQVMLVIDAEPGVRAQTDEVQVVIRGGTGAMAQWQERLDRSFVPGDNAEWPMELALLPLGDDASRVYEATATALSTSGDPVARVRAISGYRKGKTLVLRLLFEDVCRAQVAVCGATQTCRAGACVDADVDAMSLDQFKPGVARDAGTDSGVDGTSGSGGVAGNAGGMAGDAADAGGTGGTGASGTGGTGTSGTGAGAGGSGAAGTGDGTCNPPCTGAFACCKADGTCGSGNPPLCF